MPPAMYHLNPLDLLLGVIVIGSAVRALLRGFFREIFGLIGAAAGLVLACWYYAPCAVYLRPLLHSVPLAQLAAFLAIVAVTMVMAGTIGHILRRTAKVIGMGFADRLLGGIFGAVRGGLLGLTLLLALTAFMPDAAWLKTSLLTPYFLRASHAVSFIMPSELRRRQLEGIDRLKHTTPRWINPLGPSHNNN